MALLAMVAITRANVLPIQCQDLDYIDNPKIKKICDFLETYAAAFKGLFTFF